MCVCVCACVSECTDTTVAGVLVPVQLHLISDRLLECRATVYSNEYLSFLDQESQRSGRIFRKQYDGTLRTREVWRGLSKSGREGGREGGGSGDFLYPLVC